MSSGSRGSSARSVHSSSCASSTKSGLKSPRKVDSAISINTTSAGEPPVRLITKDLIRDLVVPRVGPAHLTAVITPGKFSSLIKSSRVLTKEEKESEQQKRVKEQDELRLAAKMRKEKFEEFDVVRKQNEKLNELEEEAKKKTEYLRQKANEARQEQEEEIKEINELILCAKVQAIRDSQVVEKQLIKREYKQAEADMDAMMEKIRVEGLQQQYEMARMRRTEAFEACRQLKVQIQENEEHRLLEQELKDREGEEIVKKTQSHQFEDFQKMKERKMNQRKLLESLLHENEIVRKRKEYEKEQSRTEDRWITEYQKQKAAKEEAADAEAREKKRQRELEIAKLRELQERASDLQAEKDALRARRAQEAKEREWRQKEKGRVKKEKETQENLKKSRSDQLKLQDHLRILKAQKERKDYEILVGKNSYEMKLEELQRAARRKENFKYANEVREQIKEKEKERIIERKEFFKEGVFLQQQEKRRAERLDCLRRQKLDKLKEYDIPDVYLKHVERKVQLSDKPS